MLEVSSLLAIKKGKSPKKAHDGGRTHNLLIRSQTRCHYATQATVIGNLRKLYTSSQYLHIVITLD